MGSKVYRGRHRSLLFCSLVRADALGLFAFARFAEEALDDVEAFFAEHAGGDVAAVVERWVGFQQVDPAAGGTAFGVGAAEDDPLGPAVDNGAGAHGAGFLGDVEGALFQPPVAECFLGGGEGQHFCVGGRVLEGFDLVPCAGDDPAFAHDHGTYGDFLRGVGFARLAQRLAHEIGVAV